MPMRPPEAPMGNTQSHPSLDTRPPAPLPVFPNVIGAGKFPTPSLDFFAKNFQNPQVSEFDLSLQQELPNSTFFSLSYMGAMGRELPNFLNINLNPASTYQTTLNVIENTENPGTGCGPLACGTAITSTVYSKNYVNTHYGYVTEIVSNINSSYNGMIAEVQNRSRKYAQFDANYTWSHALDYNQNQSTSPSTNNWFDPLRQRGRQLRQLQLQRAEPLRRMGDARSTRASPMAAPGSLTDGWHLNPVLQIQNGLPYSAGVSGTHPHPAAKASSGMNGSGSSGYLLQIGRNTFNSQAPSCLDCHLQKDLHISERYNIELLGEAFNVLNHQNVTGVNSTAYCINATATSTTPQLACLPAGTGRGRNASGFKTVNNADSNFVYSQRQIQLGIKLDF